MFYNLLDIKLKHRHTTKEKDKRRKTLIKKYTGYRI